MKPLRELTIEDLSATPVWRSLGGEDSTALVEPTGRTTLSQTEADTFLAATSFVLGNGERQFGFCSPVDDSGLDYLQPVIVTPHGQVRLWFDDPVQPAVLAEQWAKLGVREPQVFPVEFECLVPVDGRTVKGTVRNVASMGSAV
jgi:hypothetical protein